MAIVWELLRRHNNNNHQHNNNSCRGGVEWSGVEAQEEYVGEVP